MFQIYRRFIEIPLEEFEGFDSLLKEEQQIQKSGNEK